MQPLKNFKPIEFLKSHPALLALIFSVVAEVLFFLAAKPFVKFTQFGDPLNFISWGFIFFHELPNDYLPNRWGDSLLAIPAWLFQWWLIFYSGIIFTRYVVNKESLLVLRFIILILSATLVVSIILFIHSQYWQGSNWKDEVAYLANVQGCDQAASDFKAGELKLLKIADECDEDKYSGTNDGPFAVWIAQNFPELPWPSRFSVEERVQGYNATMRAKYEWSQMHTNTAGLNR